MEIMSKYGIIVQKQSNVSMLTLAFLRLLSQQMKNIQINLRCPE